MSCNMLRALPAGSRRSRGDSTGPQKCVPRALGGTYTVEEGGDVRLGG